MRVEARTNSDNASGVAARQTPKIGARIAGPFPADLTPLRLAGNPIHNLRMALSVPMPMPAGNPNSHQRSRQANERRKRVTSPCEANHACAVMQVCSVSSLTIP